MHETKGQPFDGVTLRDVNIKTALVIPDNNDGVETILRLQTATDSSDWHCFAAESCANGVWTVHCEGKISAVHKPITLGEPPVDDSALTQRVSGKRWYNAFDRVGFYYGKTFQQLQSVRTDRSLHHATGDVTVLESSGTMQGESRYFVHPSTVDACLQLIIISIHAGKHKEMPWGVVPTHIEEVSLFPAGQVTAATGYAVAWTDNHDEREFNTNVRLTSPDSRLLLDVRNLTCLTYDAAIPASSLEKGTGSEPFSIVSWMPDIQTLTPDTFARMWPSLSSSTERLSKFMELISHRQQVNRVLVCGSPTSETVESVLKVLPKTVTITLGYDGEQELHLSREAEARTTVKTLPEYPGDWIQTTDGPHDLVMVDYSSHYPGSLPDRLIQLVKNGGWLLGYSKQFATVPSSSLQLGDQFAFYKTETHTNGVTLENGDVTILSLQGSQSLSEAISAPWFDRTIREKSIKHFLPEQDLRVVIDDTTGTLMNAMSSDAGTFEAVKTVLSSGNRTLWLTQGVKQGRTASAGMAEGLLRTLRSEQAAARIMLLDIDHGEKPEDMGKAISSKLAIADTKDSGHDTEFWLHKGCLHISRVYPYESLNQNESQAQEMLLPQGVLLKAKFTDGQLIFEPHAQRPTLSDDEVEAQVFASELQQSASGSQLVVCGTILRVGSSVDQFLVGRRIVTFSYDGLQTMVYTSAYAVLDQDERLPPETLLSASLPLYPVVNLCLFRNKMAKGDFLLLLPGPKPFTTTVAKLAKAIGWKLNIIVNSCEEKAEYISQLGFSPEQVFLSDNVETVLTLIREQCENSYSGAMDIIAHNFSPLAQEIWRCIPAFCRFMVGDTSGEAGPDPLPFTRGATFVSTTLKALRASPQSAAGLLKLSLQMLKTFPDLIWGSSDGSVKVVDVGDVSDPFRHVERQQEASVVRFGYGESRVKVNAMPFPPIKNETTAKRTR